MTTPIAVSLGCPSGVGPEVAVVAAATARDTLLLVGDLGVVRRAATLRGLRPSRFVKVASAGEVAGLGRAFVGVLEPVPRLAARDVRYGAPSIAGGAAQLAWVDAACDLASSGAARAMVTGPVSKEAIVRSRAPGSRGFIGHTEHLQARLGAGEVVMAFWTPRLATALVTTHLALRDVPRAITRDGVASTVYWLAELLHGARGRVRRPPRIAVAGLNPHAGEHGLFGDEEARLIAPGIEVARKRLQRAGRSATIVGPLPAETAFRVAAARGPSARGGGYDGVVALYHDQATIPMKLVGFGEAVNVSLGLPIVRTSVDHGTAYDVAGEGVADARGMVSALDLARRLAPAA